MSYMPSENLSLLAGVDPVSGTAANSAWVALSDHAKILAVIQTGAAAAGNVNAKLVGATDAAGSNPVDLTGYALAQILQAAASSKQALIEVKVSALAQLASAGLPISHLRLEITAATASLLAGVVFGVEPKAVGPAITRHAASVVQVVGVRP